MLVCADWVEKRLINSENALLLAGDSFHDANDAFEGGQ
jgi:hypothetical protein